MPSFDAVSKLDLHEVRNAVDQANREIGNRFDFKGTDSRVEIVADDRLMLHAPNKFQIGQVLDVLRDRLARREIDLVGVYRYRNLYPTARALVAAKKIDLAPLVSKTFPLAEANKAFEYFATGEPVKVLILPNDPVCRPCAA